MSESIYPLLDQVRFPQDLKHLEDHELVRLSHEVRQFIIDEVCANPGHFGASLGVVELTIALHKVLDTPRDRLIWDVGHQAYAHKILTGRKDVFSTNRKKGGISGFPRPAESEYDAFGVGHSSTSISAALGMATASRLAGEKDRQVVAVIGDGSLTGGMAFEALNHAGSQKTNLLVILNDNRIAIDPNVGALKEYLLDITTSQTYNKMKNEVWHMLGALGKLGPNPQRVVQKIENALKSLILRQSNLFESLNFRYFGPVDGHDVVHLTKVLNDLKHIQGPKLLHCVTTKGKGFSPAEQNQTIWHAPGRFDKFTGEIFSFSGRKPSPVRYQDVFGQTLLELAELNPSVVGITPAMASGCSMNGLADKYPDRFFDVGIAEQHAVTFAAGLAAQGHLPFCNVYSTFMQRAYDQVIHDVALQGLDTVFCLDRAGLVGEDGPTHHGAYDLAYTRCVPGITVAAPMDEGQLRDLMYTAQLPGKGPLFIRYPRGNGVLNDWNKPFTAIPIGKGRRLREGEDIAILSIGHPGNFAAQACQKLEEMHIHAAHYDLRFLKPLDLDLLHEVFGRYRYIITVEDGCLPGGFGSAVLEFMADHGYQSTVKRLGIPDKFVEHGTLPELYRECGFDTQGIVQAALQLVASVHV